MAILSCHVSIKLPPKISDGQEIPCVPAAARRWNVEFVTPVVHELLGSLFVDLEGVRERPGG